LPMLSLPHLLITVPPSPVLRAPGLRHLLAAGDAPGVSGRAEERHLLALSLLTLLVDDLLADRAEQSCRWVLD